VESEERKLIEAGRREVENKKKVGVLQKSGMTGDYVET